MTSQRLSRALFLAKKVDDANMVRRIEAILANRDRARHIVAARRNRGPEMHVLISALQARIESSEGFAEMLEMEMGIDWLHALENVLQLVCWDQVDKYRNRYCTRSQRESVLRRELERINAQRPKILERTERLRMERKKKIEERIRERRQSDQQQE